MREPPRSVRGIRAKCGPVRKLDLRGRRVFAARLLEAARGTAHEGRNLLRALDAAASLVAHGPAPIAGDADRAELGDVDAFPEHALDGVAVDLANGSDHGPAII